MDFHSCSFVGRSAAVPGEAEIVIEGRSRHAEGPGDVAEAVTVQMVGRARVAWLIWLMLTEWETFREQESGAATSTC
jgi:hypothetical protein